MALEIGFLGLGAMGAPIADNLLAAGHHLTAWNRSPSKAEPLAKKGARVAAHPGDVAQPGGIVVSMVADDAALKHLVREADLLRRLGRGGVHVSMSTIAPATTSRLADRHRENGCALVAAPVFGRPDAAAERRLVICVSGPAAAKERVRPILDAISAGVFDFGEETGAANVVKVAGNFLIASAMEAMGEAFTMAEKHGLRREAVAKMLSSTLFACPVYQNYAAMIAERRHSPAGFRLPLGLKDVELAAKTAEEVRAPMPFASLLRDRLISALAKGREELDWSALTLGARDDAGLKDGA
jgi:3-hydroxyisobutyrate dehydrogenase-like beta-hydroxyacid dehydrogenase